MKPETPLGTRQQGQAQASGEQSVALQTSSKHSASVPLGVAAASSLALMGDSLLYAVLPTQAPFLGLPLDDLFLSST